MMRKRPPGRCHSEGSEESRSDSLPHLPPGSALSTDQLQRRARFLAALGMTSAREWPFLGPFVSSLATRSLLAYLLIARRTLCVHFHQRQILRHEILLRHALDIRRRDSQESGGLRIDQVCIL